MRTCILFSAKSCSTISLSSFGRPAWCRPTPKLNVCFKLVSLICYMIKNVGIFALLSFLFSLAYIQALPLLFSSLLLSSRSSSHPLPLPSPLLSLSLSLLLSSLLLTLLYPLSHTMRARRQTYFSEVCCQFTLGNLKELSGIFIRSSESDDIESREPSLATRRNKHQYWLRWRMCQYR